MSSLSFLLEPGHAPHIAQEYHVLHGVCVRCCEIDDQLCAFCCRLQGSLLSASAVQDGVVDGIQFKLYFFA